MKKIILLLAILSLAITSNAQVLNLKFSDDIIEGDTTTYTPNYVVNKYSNAFVAFAFTKTDVTDSLSIARMEGSMDNENFIALTGNAALTETTTDGTTVLYVTSPKYLYYRGFLACASGDTVSITNARFIIKED
jgi:hypothetical protein